MLEDIYPTEHLSPFLSDLVAYGVGVVGLLVLIAVAARRCLAYHREARRARAAFQPGHELVEGETIVVGTVEYDARKPGAIQVEVTQDGTEREDSGRWSHCWTEVDRRVRVRPFYLRRGEGERIRVEPTEKVFLVDDMDGCILVDETRRIRTVELNPGESVIAKGVLRCEVDYEGSPVGYRDMPMGWLLTRSRREPIFLSTEPLEARFIRWRRFHFGWLVAFALTLIGAQVVLSCHHARVFAGETSWAEVASKRHYVTTDSDGDKYHHYALTSRLPWGEWIIGDVDLESFERAKKGTRVPVRHVDRSLAQYGRRASLHWILALCIVGGFALLLGTYVVATRRARPWYSAPVVDRGAGRLDPETGLPRRARREVAAARKLAGRGDVTDPDDRAT